MCERESERARERETGRGRGSGRDGGWEGGREGGTEGGREGGREGENVEPCRRKRQSFRENDLSLERRLQFERGADLSRLCAPHSTSAPPYICIIRKYTYICKFIYTHTHTHTYTYIYTHIYNIYI